MPRTFPIMEPFCANETLTRLVPEATGQTYLGNNFVQLDANGRAAAAPATPTDGSLLTNVGFVLEPGHNYTANNAESQFGAEILANGKLIEITLSGVAAQGDLIPGRKYGLSIGAGSDGINYYYADRTKTAYGVVEFIRVSGRGLLANGEAVQTSGNVGDTNIRIIVRIAATAEIASGIF